MRDFIFQKVKELPKLRIVASALLVLSYLTAYSILGAVSETDTSGILQTDPYLLLALQAFSSALFFLLVPWLMIKFFWKVDQGVFPSMDGKTIGLILLIVFSNLFVMSGIIEWNMSIDLPDGGFEDWASAKEAELKILTEHLITFEGVGHFLVALLAVAILPALGEEILFRGVLQNTFRRIFGNKHAAIWTSAILFSAIHLQFYGFFPRMLLGALFGYLYIWSGKLSVAVIAHFFHNGLALLFTFIAGQSTLKVNPDQLEKSAPIWLIAIFTLIGGYGIFKFYQDQKIHEQVEERI